jgi:pimeloyl-ACP methyl ester carboxylesterase
LTSVKDGDPVDVEHAILKNYCRGCFRQKSVLDFERTFEFIRGESGTIFVFVHGGSGSRTMFLEHAKELNVRYGHGYVLLDLPGHGSLVGTPLTPDSCAETFGNVLQECGIKADSPEKIIYVGGSLGAYLGFRLLDDFRDTFDGAVLMDCG